MDAQRVGQAFWASVIVFTLIGVYFYMTQPVYDYGPARWRRWWVWFEARYLAGRNSAAADLLLSSRGDDEDADDADDRAFLGGEINHETAETSRRVAEIQAESFTLGETTALARLVAAGKIGLTEAVKIGADARSGEKYQKRSREIKAALDALDNPYPQRTPEQQRLRKELGIDNHAA